MNRSYLKNWILVQYQGGREVQPGGILQYFEDLNRAPNTEIGPKDFFEMASIPPLRHVLPPRGEESFSSPFLNLNEWSWDRIASGVLEISGYEL